MNKAISVANLILGSALLWETAALSFALSYAHNTKTPSAAMRNIEPWPASGIDVE